MPGSTNKQFHQHASSKQGSSTSAVLLALRKRTNLYHDWRTTSTSPCG